MTNLQYHREQFHLSIDYIAGACGVTYADIIDWEHSGNAPAHCLRFLAILYGVKENDLIGEVPAISYDEKQIEILKRSFKHK